MSLYSVLWSEQNNLLKYDSLSLAQQSKLYLVYNFLPQRALLGNLQKIPTGALHSIENIATKKLLCGMSLKCLFMSFANPDLGCW